MAGRVDTGGITTALALLGAGGAAVPGDEPEQADMFEAEAALPLPEAPKPATGKAGRPAGARNRSTDEWLRYLSGRYRSPLVGLAEMWSRTPRQLAEALELYKWHEGKPVLDVLGQHVLDTGAAAEMQQRAMMAALPYWHKKQPMAIEVDQRQPNLVVIGSLEVADIGPSDDLVVTIPQSVENQGVIDAHPMQSDAPQSDEDRKP